MAKKVEEKPRARELKAPPPLAGPSAAANKVAAKGNARRPVLETLGEGEGSEHRQFPRARMQVRFDLWIGDPDDLRFSASLSSVNLSVSGAFLESTFFLPVGTELRVRFALEDEAHPVEARAQIIREERPDARTGEGRSGIGLRFVEFFGQTEVTLAKLFLGEELRKFADKYMNSKRARGLTSEMDRVVDALAAWELQKVTTPGDPWRPLLDSED